FWYQGWVLVGGYRLAVDTGGTFTDFCLIGDDGTVIVFKVPSTPDDPSRAVVRGFEVLREKGIDLSRIALFLHGTTVATNAILEKKGAPLALVTTKGFRDVIFIGRQNRPHLYNQWVTRPQPLVSRNMVFEVNERVRADGSVMVALEEEEIATLIARLGEVQVEAVAVVFLHSYANPGHELLFKKELERRLPHVSVTISSEIVPEFREYERTSTTVVNAYVQPVVARYLTKLAASLEQAGVKGFYVMQSSGGVISPAQAQRESVRTVLSGPAGGVLAGVYLARLTGYRNLITADMGGTSMDVSLICDGEARYTDEGMIGGYPLRLPMLAVHTVGAGGGSIAWVDAGGALRVGPRSAGAVPGPACYGLGGAEPTVTDANLVLGRLGAADFAGGKELRRELAARAIAEKVGEPLGLGVQEAATGIVRVVNANMVRAIRVVSVAKGYDPRNFVLVAFGGAGPLHAVELARELGIRRILIPPFPGVTSAWGMLAADFRRDYTLTWVKELRPGMEAELAELAGKLTRRGWEDLFREGFAAQDITLAPLIDLRYKGQSCALTLPLPDPAVPDFAGVLARSFHGAHIQLYGYAREEAPVEVMALRLVATGRLPVPKPPARQGVSSPAPYGERSVYFAAEHVAVPVYRRSEVGAGWAVDGPAVITQADSTTLLWPGDRAYGDEWGNIIIETGGC
ncbi:hydantoinase/oxoprolinase family protein, partial [Thermodesulfitimonas sp.]